MTLTSKVYSHPGEAITPLKYEHTFYCQACVTIASPRTCPHGPEQRLSLSGTKVRELLRAGAPPPPEFTRPEVAQVLINALREVYSNVWKTGIAVKAFEYQTTLNGVVKSLVDDIIMPPIGILTGDLSFKDQAINIGKYFNKPEVKIHYGSFVNNVLTFVIVAWAVFMLVKAMNVAEQRLRFGQQPPEDTPPPSEEVLLLREIRDSLKQKSA